MGSELLFIGFAFAIVFAMVLGIELLWTRIPWISDHASPVTLYQAHRPRVAAAVLVGIAILLLLTR